MFSDSVCLHVSGLDSYNLLEGYVLRTDTPMADHVATTFQISYWKQFIGVWREIAAPPVDTKLFIPPLSNFGIYANNVIGYKEWACRPLGDVWRRHDWKPMEVST